MEDDIVYDENGNPIAVAVTTALELPSDEGTEALPTAAAPLEAQTGLVNPYDPELAKQALDFAGGDLAGAAGFLLDYGLSDADLAVFAEQALADEELLNDDTYGALLAPPLPVVDPAFDDGLSGGFDDGFIDPFAPPPGPAFAYDPELAKQALDFAGGDLAGAAGFLADFGLSDDDLAFFAEQALADEALLNDDTYGAFFAPPPPPVVDPGFDDGFFDPGFAGDPAFPGGFDDGFIDPFAPPPGPAFAYDPELAKQALDFAGGDFAGAAGFLADYGLSDDDLAFFAEQALADEALLNDDTYGAFFAPPPPPFDPGFDDGFTGGFDPAFPGGFDDGFIDPFAPPPGPAFAYDPELAKQALDFAGGDFAGAAGFLADYGLSDDDLAFFAEQALADEALLNDDTYGAFFAPPPPPFDPGFDDGFTGGFDPAFPGGFDDGFIDPFAPPPGPAFAYDPELAKQALDFAGGDFAGAAGFLADYGLSEADMAFFAEQALADEALLNDEMYGGYFAPPPFDPAFDDGFTGGFDPAFPGGFDDGFIDPFAPPPGPAFAYDPELAKQALDFAGGDLAGAAGFLADYGLSEADMAFFAEQALADEALLNDDTYGAFFAPPPPPFDPGFDDGFTGGFDPAFPGGFDDGFIDPFAPPPGPAFAYDPELAKQALDFAGGDFAGAAGFLADYGLSEADMAFFAEQALADEALLNDEMYGGYFAPPPFDPAFDDGFAGGFDPAFPGGFDDGFIDPFAPPPGPAFAYDPELAKQALDFAGGDLAGAAGFLADYGLSEADMAFFAEQALADEALLNDEMYGGYFAPPPFDPVFDDGFAGGIDPAFPGGFDPAFPGGFDPAFPGGFDPAFPGGFDPAFPGGFDPAFDDGFAGGIDPAFPSGSDPSMYPGFASGNDPSDPLWIYPPSGGDYLADGGGYVDDGYVDDGYVDDGYVDDGYVDDGYVDDGDHNDDDGAPPPPPPATDGMADIGTIGVHDYNIDYGFAV